MKQGVAQIDELICPAILVMRGWRGGFVVKLQEALDNPSLISHHCLAHKVSLH